MNIIITGASRGIGFEIVKILSANSNNKIISIARSSEKLLKLKAECEIINPSSNVIPLVSDLNDEADVRNLPLRIREHFSTIDILINNAGAIVNKPFVDLKSSDIQYVYNVNVFSVINMIQNLLPMMNPEKRSHIVNISSMGGFQGSSKFAGLSAYSSSKAAIACLTECLAEEFKDTNIAFNCLALGAAQTEMLNEAFPGYSAPLSAFQMAEFVSDFALKSHHFMNGKIIPVSLSNP
jgi:NAD(P)-dependent dehydrogenase (short-subunit alcohol dehydrogenase family)